MYFHPIELYFHPIQLMSLRSLKAKLLKVTDAVKLLSLTGNYKHIGKTNITAIFQQVYEESKSFATVKNGFRRTGIYPCNPKTIQPITPSIFEKSNTDPDFQITATCSFTN